MIMRNVYLYFIGISLVVFGCKERQLNTNVLSAIDTIVYHKPVDTLCSQYVSKITYLQLKNSDNHMLHDVTKIKSSKDKIYIFSKKMHKLSVYTKNGAFVYEIDQQGKGYKEYMETANFTIDDKYIYILDNVKNQVVLFDMQTGLFVKKIAIPFIAWDMEYLCDGRFLFTCIPNNPAGKLSKKQPNGAVWETDSTFNKVQRLYFPYHDDYYEMVGKDVYFTKSGDKVIFHSFQMQGFYMFKKEKYAPEYVDLTFDKPLPINGKVNYSEVSENGYQFLAGTPVVLNSYIVLSVAESGYDEPVLYNRITRKISKNPEVDSYNNILYPLFVVDNKYVYYLADYDFYNMLVSSGFKRAEVETETLLENGGACLLFYEMK